MMRRLYHLEQTSDGLRIADEGARPRRWQLVHALVAGQFTLALVVGQDEQHRPLVERMIGNDDGYPAAGRTVWYRGTPAGRERVGLPAPRQWWRQYERHAEVDGAARQLTTVVIDRVRCRVLARSPDSRFLVTAPLTSLDAARVAAQQKLAAARVIVLNSELASRAQPREMPIPPGSESLQVFGLAVPWRVAVPVEHTPPDGNDGVRTRPRPYQNVNIYRASVAITAHIWAAGPRGGRLIGFEYGNSRTISGVVAWSGRRDRAIRSLAAEYQRAYWLEYANYIGGD
jgi:hypothetical protein